MAETVVVCDDLLLATLPQAKRCEAVRGTWPSAEGGGAAPSVVGSLDACRRDRTRIDSVTELAALVPTNALASIDGVFQFAASSGARGAQTLVLSRDAIGQRTMYYARMSGGRVAYASDVQSLVTRDDVSRKLDPRAIASYLSCAYVPGRGTLFEGIQELLPGHTITFEESKGGAGVEKPFFVLPPENESESGSDEGDRESIRGLRALLERTIADTLDPADEAVAFLSGGIDSSVVVALVQRALGRPLHTLSIAFGDTYKNELEWSSLVASHVGTDHTIFHLTPQAVLSALDETHAFLASPIGDPLTVPNAILFRKARELGRYVWNGEGGDPCFGGPKNLPMLLAELYGDGENQGHDASPRARSYYRAHLKCFDELSSLMTESALEALKQRPLETDVDVFFEDEGRSFVGALSAINVTWKGGHHILPKVDQLGRAAGVLPRSPLFSKSVVEYASRLPPSLKLRGSVEKFALKEAVRDLLPDAIIDRPKSGMMVPVEGWFQGALLPHARERLLGGCLPWDILQRRAVEALVDGRVTGLRPRRGVKIWLLVALESYLRQFL